MGCVFELGVLFGCLTFSTAVTHSLQYIYTATSGILDFPVFISVGLVDGFQISYYDSITQRDVPKQEWMETLGQKYWDSETKLAKTYDKNFRTDIETVGKRFNQTGGVHVFQKMYGCMWNEDSGTHDGIEMFGYDGEDFISLDLKNMRWIASVPEAVSSKLKWDSTEPFLNRSTYFHQTCVEWLKTYVTYGNSIFGRKVPPEVSLFQKDSSVVCHATGFYPNEVMITWKRDGEEMQDVNVGEMLPNMDGTFQKRAELTVSPEERKKGHYTCEVAHKSGETIVKTLIVEDGAAVGAASLLLLTLLLLLVVVVVVVVVRRRKSEEVRKNTREYENVNLNKIQS